MNAVKLAAKAYVSEGSLSNVVVKIMNEDDGMIELLVALGFVAVPGAEKEVFSLTAPDQNFKIRLFEKLRDEGVCFSAGQDWSPAEVFEFLRDNGMLTGPYRKIVWDGPRRSRVIEGC
mgnify:CR=1 FL=1